MVTLSRRRRRDKVLSCKETMGCNGKLFFFFVQYLAVLRQVGWKLLQETWWHHDYDLNCITENADSKPSNWTFSFFSEMLAWAILSQGDVSTLPNLCKFVVTYCNFSIVICCFLSCDENSTRHFCAHHRLTLEVAIFVANYSLIGL